MMDGFRKKDREQHTAEVTDAAMSTSGNGGKK
jgi:hypothetical protein